MALRAEKYTRSHMGQKDLTQKNPEYYPDASADTINALLYEERQVVKPEEL